MRVVIAVLACLMCCGEVSAQALLSFQRRRIPPVAIAPAPPTPAPTRSVDTARIFRSGVDPCLAQCDRHRRERQVRDRPRSEGLLSLFEDGVQQDLSFFAAANVPLDLAILLDCSSSMGDKMKAPVQQAAVGFASHLRQGDRSWLTHQRDRAHALHPLDADVNGASDAIRRAIASGSTLLSITPSTRPSGRWKRFALSTARSAARRLRC